ncbi:hypothetical protein [Candidatus Clostridium stratigraminis]|uniref:Uncharacterized protein n=1 Tax=Candidatus Clostridium stratigraminis TaxID=3381661 RepID=A0ABW8T1G3_9CLOT
MKSSYEKYSSMTSMNFGEINWKPNVKYYGENTPKLIDFVIKNLLNKYCIFFTK